MHAGPKHGPALLCIAADTGKTMQAHRGTLTLSLTGAVALACACSHRAPTPRHSSRPTTRRCSSACRAAAPPQFRDLKALQAAAAKAPGDLAAAIALANAYIRASRVEGDPRFLGYAQAALAPWWKDPQAPTPVLLLRATILQSSHEFDAAVADLDSCCSASRATRRRC